MNQLKEAFNNLKLDVTKAIIVPSGGAMGRKDVFELDPEDFLRFAKTDFNEGNERGLINSLTNVKRAIDCHVDEVLERIGIDLENEPDSLKAFLESVKAENDSYKLKLIQSLNFAPTYIISKTRKLRHNLEHSYQKPQIDEVKEAIDIAELFIGAINNKLYSASTEFFISDEQNYLGEWEFDKALSIDYKFDKPEFTIWQKEDGKTVFEHEIGIKDNSYFPLIRIVNSINDDIELEKSFKILLNLIDHSAPQKHVNLTQNWFAS